MAKPAGAIEPGEWTLPLNIAATGDTFYTETSPCYMYFLFRLPLMPSSLCDLDGGEIDSLGWGGPLLPRRIVTTQEIFIDTDGPTIYTEGRSSKYSEVSWTQDHASETDPPDWKAEKEDTNYETECVQFTNYLGGVTDPPLVGWVELKLWSDADGDDPVELCAVNVNTVCDTADTNTIQYYSLTTRMFDPDYPADAHMVCDVLINAYKRLLYENCPAFSLPVHGDTLVVSE